MWKRINNVSNKDTSIFEKTMRYFIFYPPTKAIRLIDVNENVRVEDILELVEKEFDLKVYVTGRSETSIVLNYNGFDLKPKWSLADISIPSGAIIRCIFKEQQAADLYIHCGFNKQILKLFDSSINIESTIDIIRKKISNKLGLPLSTFCLETYDGKKRLFDQMKLMNYDIKMHDHIYLKVWKGYEKFISSCIRGYAERYSHDDLTRHYQTQIALHIAAFYGHMELANSVMQHGARSDRPVGEHPSRQWTSEMIVNVLPEALKCPIHIAIERGQVKMVDLFVRQSILCTQIRDPITGFLPYRFALLCLISSKTKEEKQCFSEIYFYLHDKQYNLKIPLNANGDYVLSLLTSSTSAANTIHRTSTHHVNVSLPFYCRIINWYERAREKVWKKFGGHFYSISQTKRIYPRKGLLGYKVLIDGYNNTFEVPPEQLQGMRFSGNKPGADKSDRYVGYSDEEREKIIRMKTFMKQYALDERRRAKQIAAANLQQSRRPPLTLHQTSTDTTKHPKLTTTQLLEGMSSSSDFSNSQIMSSLSAIDVKAFKSMLYVDNSLMNHSLSTELLNVPEQKSKTLQKLLTPTIMNENNKPAIRIISSSESNPSTMHSAVSNKLQTVMNTNKKQFQPVMSSADAFLVSSTRVALENEQRNAMKKRELFTHIEETLQRQDKQSSEVSTSNSTNLLSQSLPADRNSILDVDSHIPLSDHPSYLSMGPIQSRHDLKIRQTTFQSYERYASASLRATAINCLEEASCFKRKSWLKQVEISKEMVKHKVQRRIHRENNKIDKKPTLLPLRANHTTSPYKSNTLKVK